MKKSIGAQLIEGLEEAVAIERGERTRRARRAPPAHRARGRSGACAGVWILSVVRERRR